MGALLTLKEEAHQRGHLDASMVDRIYNEIGVATEARKDSWFRQLCELFMAEGRMSATSHFQQPTPQQSIDLKRFGLFVFVFCLRFEQTEI